MSRSVDALVRARHREAFKFRQNLITVVAPRTPGAPRLVLELWTPDGWDGCPDGYSAAACGLVDPYPNLHDEPFELRTPPSRCDPSRTPERDVDGAWVAAAGTCVWHDSVDGPVGRLLAPMALVPPRVGDRAELDVEGPFGGHGFFVRTR